MNVCSSLLFSILHINPPYKKAPKHSLWYFFKYFFIYNLEFNIQRVYEVYSGCILHRYFNFVSLRELCNINFSPALVQATYINLNSSSKSSSCFLYDNALNPPSSPSVLLFGTITFLLKYISWVSSSNSYGESFYINKFF